MDLFEQLGEILNPNAKLEGIDPYAPFCDECQDMMVYVDTIEIPTGYSESDTGYIETRSAYLYKCPWCGKTEKVCI